MLDRKYVENLILLYKNEAIMNHRRIKSVWKEKQSYFTTKLTHV